MKNFRKVIAMVLVLALTVAMSVAGTIAYLTDTDSQKNVMTTGKVNILQDEQQRNEAGELVDFAQDKPLLPMVDTREEGEETVVDGYFNEKMKNVVDKIVTVKNEAKEGAINEDAYVRTILAFETQRHYKEGSDTEFVDMHDTYIGVLGDFEYLNRYVTIDGIEYTLAVKVYDEALAPQEISDPSLKQIFLAPTAGNEAKDIFGDEYTILALSQGVQVAGFEEAGAKVALDEAFGDLATIDDATLIAWLSVCEKA